MPESELQKRADRAEQSVLFFLAGANFWEKHAKNRRKHAKTGENTRKQAKNRRFLVLIFLGGKLVGANFYALCNYAYLCSLYDQIFPRDFLCQKYDAKIWNIGLQNYQTAAEAVALKKFIVQVNFCKQHSRNIYCQKYCSLLFMDMEHSNWQLG